MKPWHEQDEFWETYAPIIFTDRHWEAAANEVDNVLSLTQLAPGSAVLDLACGPGRHSLELARRGFFVTGVDRTAVYLDQAQERAGEEDLTVEWVQADMRDFSRAGAFDAAINLYTSFGYFADSADDQATVHNVFRSLRPHGVLVVQLTGKEVLARIFQERDLHEGPDRRLVLQEWKIAPGWDWIENRWIVVEDESRSEYRFSQRLYSAAELCSLLLDCGFASAEPYGDLQGAPYDHMARGLVVVAHKADDPC